MAWTSGDYPVEMHGLEPEVRAQAIQIANELLQQGYQQDNAVSVAISRARLAVHADKTSQKGDLHVVIHETGWAVKREESKEGEFVFSNLETRDKALAKAIELGRYEGVSIVVHAEDGNVDQYVDPSVSA
jgi:uncharacterized protein YdaT